MTFKSSGFVSLTFSPKSTLTGVSRTSDIVISISESGTESHTGKMVKHGSGHLRYYLMNVAEYVFLHEPIFTEYYYKKRNEGKCHRIVCNHIAKKLIRIIYKLETENIKFDSSKCI